MLEDFYKETLNAFADNNMDVSKTARQLYLHRNTMVYRLERIKIQTGLNPYKFHELVKLLELYGKEDRDEIN